MSNEQLGIQVSEQPRERFAIYGAKSLATHELLALILESGTKGQPVLELAQAVLQTSYDLAGLRSLQLPELLAVPGIGRAKAMKILAAIELGRRIQCFETVKTKRIRSPRDCAQMYMDDLRFEQQEQFICVYLNTKNEIIFQKTIYIGGLNSITIHPREVFQQAIRVSAASLICVHNHPSGDPTPSQDDIQTTKRLIEVGELVGIEVLDHIIVGNQEFVSLKEKGYF
ncbi:MAG: RadC family protein [Culicoidibacterales bacterium]